VPKRSSHAWGFPFRPKALEYPVRLTPAHSHQEDALSVLRHAVVRCVENASAYIVLQSTEATLESQERLTVSWLGETKHVLTNHVLRHYPTDHPKQVQEQCVSRVIGITVPCAAETLARQARQNHVSPPKWVIDFMIQRRSDVLDWHALPARAGMITPCSLQRLRADVDAAEDFCPGATKALRKGPSPTA